MCNNCALGWLLLIVAKKERLSYTKVMGAALQQHIIEFRGRI